jgi:hypothetical protein
MNVLHYIGFDVHKKTVSYCIKTAAGEIVEEGTLPAQRAALRQWAEPHCSAVSSPFGANWSTIP